MFLSNCLIYYLIFTIIFDSSDYQNFQNFHLDWFIGINDRTLDYGIIFISFLRIWNGF